MTDKPWAMARVASRRPLPKPRKMHAPVGDERTNLLRGPFDVHCRGCGYYVCSCLAKPLKINGIPRSMYEPIT